MLFVKNMVFLDNAVATLAPDLDMIDEVAQMSIYFATRHGEKILADVGIDPRTIEPDMAGVKLPGVDDLVESLDVPPAAGTAGGHLGEAGVPAPAGPQAPGPWCPGCASSSPAAIRRRRGA